nr:hypothetical protein P5642_14245 [Bacillus subtilis]
MIRIKGNANDGSYRHNRNAAIGTNGYKGVLYFKSVTLFPASI